MIAKKELTEEEAGSLGEKLESGKCDIPGEDDTVVIQQDLGGKNLDEMKEEKGRILLLRDYEKMGEMATIDIIIGIGDRFNIGPAGNVNFANIVLGTDGNVHPIDYDIEQSGVADNATPYNEAVEQAIATKGQSIADMVFTALMDEEAKMGSMIIHDKDEIEQSVLKGYQTVLNRLNELSSPLLKEIKDQGEEALNEEYGTGIVERIGLLTKSLVKESISLF